MDRIRVYTGGVASCNGYLFKTRDNTYVAVDAPSGFADWIYSKKPDIIITDLLITHQHFDHVEDALPHAPDFRLPHSCRAALQ